MTRRRRAAVVIACLAVTVFSVAGAGGCGKRAAKKEKASSGSAAKASESPTDAGQAEQAPTPTHTDAALAELAAHSVGLLESLATASELLPDCDKIAKAWEPLIDAELSHLKAIWDLQGQASTADRLDRAFDALSSRSGAALDKLSPILAACETHPAIIAARESLAGGLR